MCVFFANETEIIFELQCELSHWESEVLSRGVEPNLNLSIKPFQRGGVVVF